MRKTIFVIGAIFLIALLLRFYRLGEIPVGFHRDEAFLGYNAYSILKTGKDMNSNFLPLHLQSFIYSPAGYSYIAIPFIKLFDLSAFSVRFPSALFGALTVLTTYFLTRELFKEKNLSIIAAAMLAISPWHINLSRTATENVIVVFFISLGVLFYLLWIRKDNFYILIASFACFAITFSIYQAPRVFLLLFIPLMIFFLKKDVFGRRKVILTISLFLISILLPLLLILSSRQLSLRLRTVSIFATSETQLTIDESLREDGVSQVPTAIVRFYHNKLAGYSSQVIKNYFAHFSFDFLFTNQGLPTRYKVPNSGLLYLFELPLLLLGIWGLLKNAKKEGLFVIGWVILGPIGSALTFDDVPNIQRTLIIFPSLSIVSASGLHEFFILIKKNKKFFKIGIVFAGLIAFYNFSYYLHQYYIHQLVHQPWYRHEGYKELVGNVNSLLPNYEKIVVTNSESAPTIFFLFYGKYDPRTFQEETKATTMKDFDRIDFGKYVFSVDECPLREFPERDKSGQVFIETTGEEEILYVNHGTCQVPEQQAEKLSEIKRGDWTVVFRILELKKKTQ